MNKNNKMITCYNMGQPSNEFEPYTQNGGVSPTLLSRMGTGGESSPHCSLLRYTTEKRCMQRGEGEYLSNTFRNVRNRRGKCTNDS